MRSILTVVFVSTMATACVGEPDVSMRTQGVLEENQIAINQIAINQIAINQIAINQIAINQISSNLFLLATNGLLETADGRELLKYIVTCAIPSGITLLGEHEDVTYEFPGDIGLAPSWIDRALGESEQRWVSACLLARVNRFGIPVSISIRGPHKALKVSEAEARNYSVEEGAFYGNVFTAVEEPVVWNACRGRDEAISESGTLDLRDCSEPDPENPGFTLCSLNYAGDCARAPWKPHACKKFRTPADWSTSDDPVVLDYRDYRGGYYEQCYDSAVFGPWQQGERFTEVITVFVKP
jgi:hypothetical protein